MRFPIATRRRTLSTLLLLALISTMPAQMLAQTTTGKSPPKTVFKPTPEVAKLLVKAGIEMSKAQWQNALKTLTGALKISRKKKDKQGEATAIFNTGTVYYQTNALPEAKKSYEQARLIYQQAGDKQGEGKALNNLAIICYRSDELPKALESYQKALLIYQKIGQRTEEARTLNNIGVVYSAIGEPLKALEYYQKTLPIYQAIGDKASQADTYFNVGNVYSDNGEPVKALSYYQKALPIYQENGKQQDVAGTLFNIGTLYSDIGEPQKALEFYQKVLPIYQTIGNKQGEANTLNNIGIIYADTGEPQKALEYYQKALPIYQATENKKGEADTFNNFGNVYSDTTESSRTLEFYQKALLIYREIGSQREEAGTLYNMGNVYHRTGETSKAFEFYQKALPILQATGNREGRADTLNSLGNVYFQTGEPLKALEYYQKALPIQLLIGNKQGAAITTNNIGNVYFQTGDPRKALEYYQKALPIHRAIGNKQGEADTLNSIGNAYSDMSESQKALDAYQQVLPIYQTIGSKQGEAYTFMNLGQLYSRMGEPSKALEYYQKAQPIQQAIGNKQGEASTLYGIGRVYLAQSDFTPAEKAIQQSLALTESIRTTLTALSTETKTAFQAQNNAAYLHYVQVLLLENKPQEAYVALQRTKGRILLEQFQTGQVKLTGHLTKEEQREETNLTFACNNATTRLLSTQDFAEVEKAKKELAAAESDLNTFYDRIYTKYPDFATRRAAKTETLEEIAQSLPADTALVEFLTLKLDGIGVTKADETLLFVITKEANGKPNLTVHHLMIPQAELTEKVNDLRAACADNTLRPYQTKAKDMYQILRAPIEKELVGKSRLVICPDGILWDVPFAVLMDKDGKHLVEKNEIAFAYSGTAVKAALDASKAQKPTTRTLLALADPDFGNETRFRSNALVAVDRPILIPDRAVLPGESSSLIRGGRLAPLPGTAKEAKSIARDFGAKATILTGKAAQEKTLKATASQYRYLHLATHGYFNDSAPFQSFIALAQPNKGDTENGLLTAREVFDLDLSSCEMVVLSACESGRGKKQVGEGIIGLTWALFAAGCPTQIVSSWKVSDDATATLMTRFYQDLSAGKSKGASLRQASLSLLASDKYQHPYYWSPFNLIGAF